MEDKIDTFCTDTPVCPYCGEKDEDWGESFSDMNIRTIKAECCSCDRTYTVEIEYSATFCSTKLER